MTTRQLNATIVAKTTGDDHFCGDHRQAIFEAVKALAGDSSFIC
jgi:hypothetical protein